MWSLLLYLNYDRPLRQLETGGEGRTRGAHILRAAAISVGARGRLKPGMANGLVIEVLAI